MELVAHGRLKVACDMVKKQKIKGEREKLYYYARVRDHYSVTYYNFLKIKVLFS